MTGNSGQDGPTVTARFTRALLQTAARLGVALPEALVAEAGAGERVSLELQERLWSALCAGSQDPLIGLELGLTVQVGHLDAAGMLLVSCETFGEAMESLLEYHPIVSQGGDFALREDAAQIELVYRPRYRVCREARVEAALACLLNLGRWATGGAIRPEMICFSHPPLAPIEEYERRLDTPVAFDTNESALHFPASARNQTLIQANSGLCRHLCTLADDQLAKLGCDALGERVRVLLRANPAWRKERVAEALGMSGRHLLRRLAEEGLNFRLLRARLLRDIAERGLRNGQSVAFLTERLGFAEEGAFTRAFTRWSGRSPARFRAESK